MIVRMKVMTRRAGFEHTHGFSGSDKRSLSWLLARQRTWADRTAIARYLGSRVPAQGWLLLLWSTGRALGAGCL